MKRGAFILLEGVDRSGKTTQCKRLIDALTQEGIKAKFYNFPNRNTVIGEQINQYLQNKSEVEDHCIHLLFSANRWEARKSIIDDLCNGYTIICDRYFASGVAFSAAKGMDIEWCLAPDRGLPAPDIIYFLDVNEEVQMERGGFGNERYEVAAFQRNVRRKFFELKGYLSDLNWHMIDANKSEDEVFAKLKASVDQVIKECENHAIDSLYCVYYNKYVVLI